MISIWEKQSFLTSDVLILGAGMTGLSCAASLKETNPSLDVTVLERGVLPTGASTKNAGFACFGSTSELMEDIQSQGKEGMVSLVHKRWAGLRKTILRLGKEKMDLQMKSGYELIPRMEVETVEVDTLNELLFPIFQAPVFHQVDQKIKAFGFHQTNHLIENQFEGQLDTGKLMRTLWDYCTSLGVKIHTGCEAHTIEEHSSHVQVQCASATFQAKKLGLCTNAFAQKLIPNPGDLYPGRGMVLLVTPQKPLAFEGSFHYDQGFYYFRDYHHQLIFGGGRNLDPEGETTTDFGINEQIKNKLIRDLTEVILPNQPFQVDMEWSGIMAFGKTKEPIIQKSSDKVAIGVRLGGMGVAIGSMVGEEVARMLLE